MIMNPAHYPADWNLAEEKRKPIEAWVNVYEDGGMAFHDSKECADLSAGLDRVRCVHLVEEPPPEKILREGWTAVYPDGTLHRYSVEPVAVYGARVCRAKMVEIPE